MPGKKYLFIILSFIVLCLTACSKKNNNSQGDYEERILLAIDAREFQEAIHIIEEEMPEEEASESKYQVLLANASMGAGGLDMIELGDKVRSPINGLSAELKSLYADDCPKGNVGHQTKMENSCWLVRLMHHLPKPNNQWLLKAAVIYQDQIDYGDELSDNNKVLIAVLRSAEMFKRFGNMLQMYVRSGSTISQAQAQEIFDELLIITQRYGPLFDSLKVLPEEVNKRLTGNATAELLTVHADKLVFVEETGIPFLTKKLDQSNQTLTAKLTRIFIVQEIDFLLHEYFYR